MTAARSAMGSPCSRRARTSIASASVGGPISAASTKRSSCDSGSGYVPWNSAGFCVATTKNGRSSVRVVPSTVTWPSPIASSSADCVRGVARLTSSASTILAKIGPATNSKVTSFWLNTLEPVMSEGSRSGVHWMRRNVPPTDVAKARASIVLPVPGRSWRRTWPRSEEHTSELQSPCNLVCRLLLEKKKKDQLVARRLLEHQANQDRRVEHVVMEHPHEPLDAVHRPHTTPYSPLCIAVKYTCIPQHT